MQCTILIVEDEPGIRHALRGFLQANGYAVAEAQDAKQATSLFADSRPDAVVLDYCLPDGDGLELMARFKEMEAAVPIVILTGHGSIELAVRAIKEGADHFLTKPLDLSALLVILKRLMEGQREHRRQLAGRSRRAPTNPFGGRGPAVEKLASDARRVLASPSPILILGETGSGKSVLARWLHDNGPQRDEAFVDLNCAALSHDLLESELFGHEKGAFTGAHQARPGLLDAAHRGTLFLDEIGDMDLGIQGELLKVLEEKRFRRLGDVRDRHVDIRLIAATHQDLAAKVRERTFRGDLYFRVSALPLTVPPLRERREELPALARSILRDLETDLGRGKVTMSSPALTAILAYPWPGNVRELRNVLERALLLTNGRSFSREDLRFEPSTPVSAPDGAATLKEVERRHIESVLRRERGRVERAAQILGIPRSTLYQKIKQLGIHVERDAESEI